MAPQAKSPIQFIRLLSTISGFSPRSLLTESTLGNRIPEDSGSFAELPGKDSKELRPLSPLSKSPELSSLEEFSCPLPWEETGEDGCAAEELPPAGTDVTGWEGGLEVTGLEEGFEEEEGGGVLDDGSSREGVSEEGSSGRDD